MPKRARSVPSGKGGDSGCEDGVPWRDAHLPLRARAAPPRSGHAQRTHARTCTPGGPGATLSGGAKPMATPAGKPARTRRGGEVAVADEAARRAVGGDRPGPEATQLRPRTPAVAQAEREDARQARALAGVLIALQAGRRCQEHRAEESVSVQTIQGRIGPPRLGPGDRVGRAGCSRSRPLWRTTSRRRGVDAVAHPGLDRPPVGR